MANPDNPQPLGEEFAQKQYDHALRSYYATRERFAETYRQEGSVDRKMFLPI